MIHARKDYNRIQDPALNDLSLLSEGSTPIAEDEPVFLVRASDQAFVATLEAWAKAHNEVAVERSMSAAVASHIELALEWQRNNRRKVADAPVSTLSR